MGWREMLAYVRVMVRQLEQENSAGGTVDNPGSWNDRASRENFAAMHEKRRRRRGH